MDSGNLFRRKDILGVKNLHHNFTMSILLLELFSTVSYFLGRVGTLWFESDSSALS